MLVSEASGGVIVSVASFAAHQAVEAVVEYCAPRGPIKLRASFDEFDVNLQLLYHGSELEFPDQPPSRQELLTSEDDQRRLAGYLIRGRPTASPIPAVNRHSPCI